MAEEVRSTFDVPGTNCGSGLQPRKSNPLDMLTLGSDSRLMAFIASCRISSLPPQQLRYVAVGKRQRSEYMRPWESEARYLNSVGSICRQRNVKYF